MAFGKRQLVLAALVLALGAAVYLNWQFSDNKELLATNAVSEVKELGEAQYVNNLSVDEVAEMANAESNNEEQSGGEGNPAQYFEQAKANRQKARDEATDMIKEILNDIKSSEEAKAEAVKQAADVAKGIQQESNIENLIKAKGFKDCVVFLQNGECSVVVSADGLNENSAITIKDIVLGQSGVSFDKIKITEAK